ncbi:MAG: pyruvate kinase, partial [Pseudomonadota bacterium]
KILATLGPASSDEETIRSLFEAGTDIFRFNFSHGTHADHLERLKIVRGLEDRYSRPVTVLQDLQGPKIRIGTFKDDQAMICRDDTFRLCLEEVAGDQSRVTLPHREVFAALEVGQPILLDDGKLRLEVVSCGTDFAQTRVVTGGTLSNRKGVNLPGVMMPISPLTDKDREDLEFGLEAGFDWIALSFVQRAQDVADLKRIVQGRAGIVAKVEKPSALDRLGEIVSETDAIMIARGDLGVEIPPEDVPGWQKDIIRTCRLAGKPVIVATQMLDSMVNSPAPTRAEASDVALAIYDGADAVMLSAESAMGHYPIKSVQMMDRIITRTEMDKAYRPIIDALHPQYDPSGPAALASAAAQVADDLAAKAIVTYTTSGATTFKAAQQRPHAPLLTLTPSCDTARRLGLVWGTYCVNTNDATNFQDMGDNARSLAVRHGFAGPGDKIIVLAGVPFGTPGATNVLHVIDV